MKFLETAMGLSGGAVGKSVRAQIGQDLHRLQVIGHLGTHAQRPQADGDQA
ncbi:MAG: hypothetical protein H6662_00270 [Ardenticatenaceae bacterium]|nr:hypothetical protein [Ardenticatenaceae bacterium]